ncbi:unnamed protein product [Amoebophrya sp. A120]|nr:unnamed protein product [Amoebophrya sp. A120]|eukprot:GSA120T00013233001.1
MNAIMQRANCDFVYVFGDVHGAFEDLLRVLHTLPDGHKISDFPGRIVFLGDYLDRATTLGDSFSTLFYLLWLEATYPDKITLLLGNHEDFSYFTDPGSVMNTASPQEHNAFFGHFVTFDAVKTLLDPFFATAPLGAVAYDEAFIVHAGILGRLKPIEELRSVSRPGFNTGTSAGTTGYTDQERAKSMGTKVFQTVPGHGGPPPKCSSDAALLWADPARPGHTQSRCGQDQMVPGGRPWTAEVAKEFFSLNGIRLLLRGHEPGEFSDMVKSLLICVTSSFVSTFFSPV